MQIINALSGMIILFCKFPVNLTPISYNSISILMIYVLYFIIQLKSPGSGFSGPDSIFQSSQCLCSSGEISAVVLVLAGGWEKGTRNSNDRPLKSPFLQRLATPAPGLLP